MSRVKNLDFAALNISGDNYFQWALDIKIVLKSKGLGECITDDNNESKINRSKAISIIRHHLTKSIKDQYLTIKNPLDLWKELKARYDQRAVLLAKVMYDWRNLRIQDFKSVDEYNSALFEIVSKLKLCGEDITEKDMIENTFFTFHTSNAMLQQYCEQGLFTTYASLIPCLLLAEQNNELLMRNSELRPPGSTPLPEVSVAAEAKKETNHVQRGHRQHGRGRGRWQGRGHGHYNPYGQRQGRGGRGYQPDFNRGQGRGRGTSFKLQDSTTKSVCHRCGMGNHCANICRTPKHFVDLYQESIKGKNHETHLVHEDNEDDFDHEKDDLMAYETSDCLK